MSDYVPIERLPYEMHRTILDFTDPGFEPLKRVNKIFYQFEKMPHRTGAVAEIVKKRREEFDEGEGDDEDEEFDDENNNNERNMHKMVPYVTSVNLLQWAVDELEMPRGLVCRAIAYSGHLDVLQWARAQDPQCDWNADVCSDAALKGHLHVLKWAPTRSLG